MNVEAMNKMASEIQDMGITLRDWAKLAETFNGEMTYEQSLAKELDIDPELVMELYQPEPKVEEYYGYAITPQVHAEVIRKVAMLESVSYMKIHDCWMDVLEAEGKKRRPKPKGEHISIPFSSMFTSHRPADEKELRKLVKGKRILCCLDGTEVVVKVPYLKALEVYRETKGNASWFSNNITDNIVLHVDRSQK